MCLDIVNGGALDGYAQMRPCGRRSGQHWRLTRHESGGSRLTTEFRGDGMCLDIVNGGENDRMAHLVACGNATGQQWMSRTE